MTYVDTLCPWDSFVPKGGYRSALKDRDETEAEPLTKNGDTGNVDGYTEASRWKKESVIEQ